MGTRFAGMVLLAVAAWGQVLDPAYAPLGQAYEALHSKDYDRAIGAFEQAAALAPARADIRTDLAYTLLKVGDSEAARDQFAEAMRLNPTDEHIALEYAFLCYETKQPVMARRVFDRIRKSGNATAVDAFENIDRPLREGIARWKQALELSPDNFSAHEELARLAEQRDELDLSADQFQKAWGLRSDRRDLLLDLGRVWKQQGHLEDANAALLAASRGAEPRVAEEARELLPTRYPYVYEFEKALALDPTNAELRRELAYLHVAMGNRTEADKQLEQVPKQAPALDRPDPLQALDAKAMGEKSLEKGYLGDALKYLHAAHEEDPADFEVMLKLGWAYNSAKDDRTAERWFDSARRSPDAQVSAEATRAYRNLRPAVERWRTTVWAFPMISTRWADTFAYAQVKTELRRPLFPLHFYFTARFIGDTANAVHVGGGVAPEYLSEHSVILGAGVAAPVWRGLGGWFEAGEAMGYGSGAHNSPDYRGGITYNKGIHGPHRLFAETSEDGIFVSRFDHDLLLYSQNRVGRLLSDAVQVYWNLNATVDAKGEYWANTAETGPGIRFHLQPFLFSVNFLRGAYLVNRGNPKPPNYNDVRIGVWYAFTR
jgi:Tfp pilus assembly protein PilF